MLDYKQPIETGDIPDDGADFDVIVVGGGPGGSAAAAYNAMNGCKVLLIEKGTWPRDKPCGDAVGGKSLSHAKELGVLELIDESPHYVVDSIVFGSANGSEVRVMLPKEAYEKQGLQSGYSLPREQFDYLMFHKCQEIVRENGGSVIQGFTVTEVNVEGKGEGGRITGVKGKFGRSSPEELVFNSALTIGAGGYNCPVSRTITLDVFDEPHRDDDHFCGGYREYWDNVEGLEGNEGQIEIHFVDEVIPGYFWLFPVGEGVVNVGIGMLISEEREAKKKGGWRGLKKTQEWLIREHPRFKERFANSKMVPGSGKGWQLPFGSPRKNPPSHQPRRGLWRVQ